MVEAFEPVFRGEGEVVAGEDGGDACCWKVSGVRPGEREAVELQHAG